MLYNVMLCNVMYLLHSSVVNYCTVCCLCSDCYNHRGGIKYTCITLMVTMAFYYEFLGLL